MRRHFAVIAATLFFAAPAFALDMPMRKAGLWEMKMVFEGSPMPPQAMRQCIDQATDKAMQAQYGGGGAQGATCSKQDFKNAGGGTMTFDTVCKTGPTTTATKGTITGSFDSGYTMKITSTSAGGPPVPGMAPGGETRMTIEAKYLGGCQAGQKPGDIMMGNGVKMNIRDMQKMGAGGGMGAPGGGMMAPVR
ncbi:MAG TPA: DUF3617 family protein [Xanthobacteraceae bacterium]|nr:DUF3617 family protein [Xanthobacteraceae bacterium]